ncbi:MAG: septum formation initiator family protein [Bacteroidota bacterium]
MKKNLPHTPIDVVEMPAFNDRAIYNNALSVPLDPQVAAQGYADRHNVRVVKSRRRTKTSNIVGILFLVAVLAVIYVGNVIAVNNLAKEVNDLNARYTQILSTNEVIKAEINRKASLERISLLAQEKLNMVNPREAPVWFEVSTEKVEEVKEKLAERAR